MLTEFGKELRRIRLNTSELLKDMAYKLDVTDSYLSAIEHGKREIPAILIKKIMKEYDLNKEDADRLDEAANNSKSSLKIDLQNASIDDKKLANAFARKFNKLNKKDIERVLEILNKEGRD